MIYINFVAIVVCVNVCIRMYFYVLCIVCIVALLQDTIYESSGGPLPVGVVMGLAWNPLGSTLYLY